MPGAQLDHRERLRQRGQRGEGEDQGGQAHK